MATILGQVKFVAARHRDQHSRSVRQTQDRLIVRYPENSMALECAATRSNIAPT